VSRRIKALGLQEIVQLRGFVDEDALDQAVAASDMVFNLRYPTIGEASGTQMRIWNNSAPSAVTDDGWFKFLPDDTVLKIAPGDEIAAIGSILDKLAVDRRCYDSLGARGRATLIELHSPVDYAASVFEFLKQFGAFERRHSQSSTSNYLRQRQNSICADEPRGRKAARTGSQTQKLTFGLVGAAVCCMRKRPETVNALGVNLNNVHVLFLRRFQLRCPLRKY